MRSFVLALALGAALAAAPLAAQADQVRFVGIHPIATEIGGGFCYIEGPHVHAYAPIRAEVLFRLHDGAYYFVGDPVPYGYDGPKHAYYGHHPVPVDVVLHESELDGDEVEYCYLGGAHYHYFVPAPNTRFTVKGGVHWYVGHFPEAYRRERARYVRVNAVYRPLNYARPTVVVAPPPEAHVEAAVGVGVGLDVHVPAPSFSLSVGVPAVVVEDHHHDVVVVEGGHFGGRHKHKGRGRKWRD